MGCRGFPKLGVTFTGLPMDYVGVPYVGKLPQNKLADAYSHPRFPPEFISPPKP